MTPHFIQKKKNNNNHTHTHKKNLPDSSAPLKACSDFPFTPAFLIPKSICVFFPWHLLRLPVHVSTLCLPLL